MTSKLYLLVILLIYIISKSNVASAVEDNEQQLEMKRMERDSSYFEPFHNLFKNIKTFFGVKTKIIQEKKKRVKTAFELFYKEMIRKNELDVLPLNPRQVNRSRIEPQLKNKYVPKKAFGLRPELSVEQLIMNQGYQSESHTVLTEDGYMVTMQRVLPDLDKFKRRTVLIHHGLLESAEDWLFLGQTRSLPYMLAENGFDVWLLNARGNRYSRIHTSKSTTRQDFWDFSWHEIGVYDLPAVIKYVSEVTRKAEINFIGHSMGATALLVLLSTVPEYNYMLRSGILLAPLAFMYHVKGPIKLLAEFYRLNGHNSLYFLGQTEFIPDGVFPEQIIEKYCKGDQRTCSNALLLLANGGNYNGVYNDNLIEDILNHVPAGGSVKTILHYVQLVKSGYFQMFDYGDASNIIKYQNSTPPLYNLNQVTLPIALFSSPSDWLSTDSDIQTLMPLLQNVYVHHVVKAEDFGHLDFVWSPDAPELVYDFVLTVLDQILPKPDAFFDD